MSFNWDDYLFLAQELATHPSNFPNQEARLRSAISRAYYSAFCKARDFLRDDRRCADYDDVIRDLPFLANKALGRAQDIVSTLDKI